MSITKKSILLIFFVLLVDQVSKVYIKLNFAIGEHIDVFSWFKIYFIENNGMAFGMEFIGKMFLSIFRIVAIGFIGYYLYKLINGRYKTGYIICISLILAGAFGNIIDSVFYGEIFSASYSGHVASFVSLGDGYSSWLHGKVVDMLYFPLIESTFPSWVPVWGGQPFVFFSAIFNIADSAITVGIFILLLFYRKTLALSLEKNGKA